MYHPKVLDHFCHPRNFGRLKNPAGTGKVGNLICGDVMWLYIQVARNKKGQEVLQDVKFETYGCVAAISTSSLITELVKGKTLTAALKITKDQIAQRLGGLPPIKMHCSVLAVDALAEAIYDYLSRKKRKISVELQKRHRRLEREKDLIQEKYADWIQIEEKMHLR